MLSVLTHTYAHTKENKEIVGGSEYVPYIDHGDSIAGLSLHANSPKGKH